MKTIDPKTGELAEFESHNYNLLEDTAEIEYIFADKTGTLTKNELQFRCITLVTDSGDDT